MIKNGGWQASSEWVCLAGLSTGSALLVLAVSKYIAPDYLHTPMTLLANFTAVPVEVRSHVIGVVNAALSCSGATPPPPPLRDLVSIPIPGQGGIRGRYTAI